MVGQNGVGKSVLMHVLGNDILIGLPQNVRFLYIKQLEEFKEGRTVLEEVLSADTERESIIREAQALQSLSSSSSSSSSTNKIIYNILLTRSSQHLTLAQKIATLRSGQRGHTARQALLLAESSHSDLQSKNPEEYITEKMVNEVMEEVFRKYEVLDVEGDIGRAKGILKGLGFGDDEIEMEGKGVGVGTLSGGWKMRVVLAKALFVKPDVLLLDEPTNHLDLPAILWLQEYLTQSSETSGQTIVVVSHDRNFLDNVTEETIVFKDRVLKYHAGNYEDWERNTEEQRRRKTRLKELEMKRKQKIVSSIQKNVAQAKSTGDDKRLGMVASRKKMRVVLAKALFVKPDVLLLDEPTNHLDLPAILWLQEYLAQSSETSGQTIVVVSHDRNFLDNVTEETIVFKDRVLKYHAGNYEDWERNTEEQRRRKTRLKELEMKRKQKIVSSIQKNVAQAKSTGDDKRLGMVASRKKKILSSIQKNVAQAKSTGDAKRLGMVASRKKKLERLGMERLEDGKRFKESYHGFRKEIVIEEGFKTAPILIPPPEPFNFPGKTFLQLSEVSFKYKGSSKTVINKVSLDIGPGARIGLLGPNGCGKSTLMNLLAGELEPTLGEVKKHHRLRIGYFSQHTVDKLELNLTPLQQLVKSYPDVVISENDARSHFGSLGISGEPVTRSIRTLSGGQRNRVALGLITFHRPHVLLLDEITNHLDMGTVESLVEALCGFEGALVVVSHDVWFLKQVIEGQEDDEEEGEKEGVLYRVTKQGELRQWTKGLEAYVERVHKSVKL
ncbi:ABC transporter F family member 3 [Leucoagaricus sp. SymC.cos]|nr:ABC transporter F family member 3 [Leucoagaricus sp. SymC.cos]